MITRGASALRRFLPILGMLLCALWYSAPSHAQETCVGNRCNVPGSIYRTINQIAVDGITSANLRNKVNLNPTAGKFFAGGPGASDNNDCLAVSLSSDIFNVLHGPCATIGHALSVGLTFDGNQTDTIIQAACGTFNENLVASGSNVGTVANIPFVNRASMPMVVIQGCGAGLVGSNRTLIKNVGVINGTSYCYAILAENNALLALKGVAVEADGAAGSCNQSDLFMQFGGTIYIDSDVALLGANGSLVACEEAGRLYVSPGISGTTALTVAGSSANAEGFQLDSNCILQSDSTIAISGSPSFNAGAGFLFYGVYQALFKLSGNPAVTSGATITGSRFQLADNTTMTVQHPPAVWPGTIGNLGRGARYNASDDVGCVGGVVGCVNLTSPTGIGSTGTVTADNMEGMTGAVELTPSGAGITSTGNVGIGLPYTLTNGVCQASLTNGTGQWPNGSIVQPASFTGATGLIFTWNSNGSALTTGDTYFIVYSCQNG